MKQIKSEIWICPKCGRNVYQVDRFRHADGRLAKHCGCCISKTKGMSAEQLAEHKRQAKIDLKRKYRREAGCMLRADIAAKAEEKRKAIEEKRSTKPKLHDAHVKRYYLLLKSRTKAAKQYKLNPNKYKKYQSKRKQELPDSYVIQNIKVMGIPFESITPKLIAIKREAMQYHRISRNIKTTIKNYWKEENETIRKHS